MIRAAFISALVCAPIASHADSVVSLAFDRWALIHGFGMGDSIRDAADNAISACSEIAAACKVEFTRANGCIALALEPVSGGWGMEEGKTAAAAETAALEHCGSFTDGVECIVAGSQCASFETEKE